MLASGTLSFGKLAVCLIKSNPHPWCLVQVEFALSSIGCPGEESTKRRMSEGDVQLVVGSNASITGAFLSHKASSGNFFPLVPFSELKLFSE